MSARSTSDVQFIAGVQHVDGIPGTFRKGGKYLYLSTERRNNVVADGLPVDGLQLIRTDPSNPTRIIADGKVFEGYSSGAAVGVRLLGSVA